MKVLTSRKTYRTHWSHDRDVEFMVDKADVDETNATASIQNISRVFEQTWVVPETDALFFSKVAQAAQKTEGYHGSTATSTYTKAKVFEMLKDILAKGKLRRYKANGSLIMYVRSEIMDALEQSTAFTRKIETDPDRRRRPWHRDQSDRH